MDREHAQDQHTENTEAVMTEASSYTADRSQAIDEAIALIISGQPASTYVPTLAKFRRHQLTSYTSDGFDPLTILNPVTHSAAYLYFITARCQDATPTNAMQLYQLLDHFIRQFDAVQVRREAPVCFTLVGTALLHLSAKLQKPLLPLLSFRIAIDRFAESPTTFTSLHAPFLRACIYAKAYRYPLDLLNYDIDNLKPDLYDFSTQDLLEYYYYGAIIYIGNKNYEQALNFLTIVISAPSQQNTVSAIQIAAYKKFVLVSLITDAEVRSLPKYTSPNVEKSCKSNAAPYICLSKAFQHTDMNQFNEAVRKSSNVFTADAHMGLVKQCYQSLRRKIIKELTQVYITVELDEMARKIKDVSAAELELILIEMISQNQLQASISMTDQHVKMVHFEDDNDETTREKISLEERMLAISALNDRVAYMDKLEGLNRAFQTKYMNLSASGSLQSTTYDEDIEADDEEDK